MGMGSPAHVPVMDCVVVGGPANGLLLRGVRTDATFVELSRPDYVKPLTDKNQKTPEIAKEKATYEVHVIGLTNTPKTPDTPARTRLFGIMVPRDTTLTEGFTLLVQGFLQHAAEEIATAARNPPAPKPVKH